VTLQTVIQVSDAATGSHPPWLTRGRVRERLGWLLAPAAAALLFAGYLRQARTVPVMADGASNALQAWDMLHGNVLLHGWQLSDVSFYTTELPQYMLVELVHGLNGGIVHLAAAMTYALLVTGAALVAKGSATGREGAVRALVAGGIMLAPSPGLGTIALLCNPDHTGTQTVLLLTWLVVDRAPRGWRLPVAVFALLTLAQVADMLVLFEGVVPLMVVCAIRMYRGVSGVGCADGVSGVGCADGRGVTSHELALAAAGAASAGAAPLVTLAIRALGGYSVTPPDQAFNSVADVFSRLGITAESVLQLYGADFSGLPLGLGALFPLVHLAGVVAAGYAVVTGLRRWGGAELLTQLLTTTIVVLLVAYTFRGYPELTGGPHEIAGVLVAGAVLGGRLLATPLLRGRHLALAGVVLTGYVVCLVHGVVSPGPANPRAQVAAWLAAHRLRYGLADYGNAGPVTVLSRGNVQVRPVAVTGAVMTQVRWETSMAWYASGAHDADFLLLPEHGRSLAGSWLQWQAIAERQFGPPAERYRVPGFEVLVWRANVLRRLPPPVTRG
jgi:hypothetical protein